MKKYLAVCLAFIIAFSQLVGFCVSAADDTAEAESTLITKTKGAYYTVVSGARATKFGISPNSKGTDYYIDPKQSDSEVTFGNSSAEYNKTSYSVVDTDVTDNTNFNSAKKFTITDADEFNSITNTSLNLYQGDSTALQEWINVPYADMRFWIKTSCEFTVTLSIASSYNGTYPHIKSTITVPAGSDWQEIRLTRDDFSDNDQFEQLVEENEGTFYFRMMVADDMLAENETVYISQPRFNNGAIDLSTVENIYVDYSYYYNNFQSYNTLEVTDSSYYTSTYNYNNEFRVTLPNVTDLSEVNTVGSLRFWVSVPKDMTVYFGLASQNSSGTYGRAFCEKTLKVSDNDAEGFQEVEIPLSELTIKEGTFSWQDIKFVALRGANNCTADTFLAVGEALKISPIEIWSSTSPEPKAAYTYVPKYYSMTGNVTVIDLDCAMDSRTQINAFTHSSFSDEYLQIAEAQGGNTRLLDVYSVTAVIAGAVESETSYNEYTEYAVTKINTDMSLLFPMNEEMRNADLLVGVAGENGFSQKTYEITDEYLIVTTSELGDFLIMDLQQPIYTASVVGSTIYDNTVFGSGVEVVRAADTAEYQSVMSFSGSSSNAPSADIINEWLVDEDAQMSLWVKAPYKSEGTVSIQIDLCLRTSSSYPHKYANATLAADGYWHELRINASAFTGNSFDSITANNYNNFYIRIKGNAVGDEYWIGSDISFYRSPITAEINDGNIELSQVAAVDTASGGWSHTGVNSESVSIYDNKFYSTAFKYTVSDTESYIFSGNAYPFRDSAVTVEDLSDYFANHGDMRTYVKNTSGHEMTFKIGVKLQYTNSDGVGKQAETAYKSVTIPGDSKWYEVRMTYEELFVNTTSTVYKVLTGTEGTLTEVYLKVQDLAGDFTSTTDELYFTPLEIYNRSLIGKSTDDINDANIVLEQIAIIDTKDGGGASDIDVSEVRIADNKFYRTAVKYYNPIIGSYSFNNTYPYKLATVTGTEFNDFIKYHGVWRTYIKNVSDHTMTFNVGIKIRFTGTTSGYAELKKEVDIPGDSKWHEVRISYDDLNLNTDSAAYKALAGTDGYTLAGVWFHLTGLDTDFTATTDELYITPLEIYNRNIEAAETTDFAREYKQTMLLTKYRSDKTNTYISKASAAVSDSPFFSNAVTYTANDTYTAGYASGQIGFVEGSGIDSELFADWYYNDNADLRFWVKAEKGTKFKLGVYITGEVSTSNAIEVAASSDWQLITIPRSAFGTSSQMETVMAGSDTVNVNIFFYAVDGTFRAAGDSISIGQCVEVYTDKAYAKGDTNCDGQIGLKDLVHIKKQALETDVNVKNCDINNSGSIEALDLTLMRKKLLYDAWN